MENYKTLRAKSIDDLKATYDKIATHTAPSLNFFREEIHRRESEAYTNRMLALAERMEKLTYAVIALSVASATFAAVSLWISAGR